jgi:hypothetical protein
MAEITNTITVSPITQTTETNGVLDVYTAVIPIKVANPSILTETTETNGVLDVYTVVIPIKVANPSILTETTETNGVLDVYMVKPLGPLIYASAREFWI